MLKFDGYQVFAELKRGSVTTIFKALDTRHDRIVLIKVLRAEADAEPQWRAQFLKESKITARLSHPNLRGIFHSGMSGDEPFLVLEYVEGPTLAELISRHKKLPIDLCLFIAKELAKAIAAVHHSNVLHRDIKPQNIFLSLTGAVKLGDLGLAHEFKDTTSQIAGTPAYMSPEQVLGREMTEASDLFSFGAVFYEILTGEAAFANRTLTATLHHVVNWDPVPIPKLRPEVPSEIIAACQKLLAKNPAERYNDADGVIAHLTRLERRYGLTTTKHHLADFLESPETYRQVALESADGALGPEVELKRHRAPKVDWGVAVVVSAIMFLVGVLFIKGVKEYFERKARPSQAASVAIQPLHFGESGYLDLRIVPPSNQSVVRIDGDSIGATPLTTPVALVPGWHEVSIYHAQLGVRTLRIEITAGDTLRKTLDLTNP